MERNELETKKAVENNYETKSSGSLERQTKLINLYPDSLRKESNEIKNERSYNLYHRNTKDHKRILWAIICRQIEQPRIDKFLEIYNFLDWTRKNLNRLITNDEIEAVI